MTLLALSGVSVRYPTATALADVSLEVVAGELVIVWGPARSGRTTLLNVAAGLRPPDSGSVAFAGRPSRASLGRHRGFAVVPSSAGALLGHEKLVIDQVAYPALRVMSRWRAQAAADAALRRCGVEELGQTPMEALSHAERIRVVVARALVREPRLVMMDEPTAGLSHTESERFLDLVRSLVRDGIAVLMSDDAEGSALVPGARVLTMQRGMLRGASPLPPADVIPLGQRRAEPGFGL
ncbi:MAG TPA: ATP-binding cassette domain-containing protein [Conexibacter sp.]|jgi:ABC-type cobalamin/Fe3+-siderophores transport system ATPase subunit|nr:ATP-binding cassette domain-containing protein [Conexibacter sp.]